jgi:hypothetical protein
MSYCERSIENPVARTVLKYAIALSAILAFALGKGSAATTKSGDAFITINDQSRSIVIATSGIEEQLALVNGHYLLLRFRSHTTRQRFLSDTPGSGEFRFTVNGSTVDGGSARWTWKSASATILKQGEIEAVVELR